MSSRLDLGGLGVKGFTLRELVIGNEAFLVSSIFLVVEPGKITFPI